MFFAIDIDETIATGVHASTFQACVDYYREELHLSIPDSATDYRSLFLLPAVLQTHQSLLGAVEGVQFLSQLGRLCYYTVRKQSDPTINEQIQIATRAWLAAKHFPNAEQVFFCRSIMHKLLLLHEREGMSGERLVLIDDRYLQVLEAFHQLVQGEQQAVVETLQARLTLVAFGTTVCPERTHGLRVLALPSWEQIASLVPLLDCSVSSSSFSSVKGAHHE